MDWSIGGLKTASGASGVPFDLDNIDAYPESDQEEEEMEEAEDTVVSIVHKVERVHS